MSVNDRLRVVVLAPVDSRLNPYIDLFKAGLAGAGVACTVQQWFSLRWFASNWRSIDVLHLHWLEHIYVSDSTLRTVRNLLSLIGFLVFARVVRILVVYTIHNLAPHSPRYPRLNLFAHWLVCNLANAVHVHDTRGREMISPFLSKRTRLYVVPHGNYITAYPNNCTRNEAREKFGIAGDAFVYLFLGQLRPNKGIDHLIAAFTKLADSNAALLIAGWAPEPRYGDKVAALAMDDPRITLHRKFVEAIEVQYFMNACDVCVLPYRSVTTSGAAILAFSFGRPIVAPGIGCFLDLVRGSCGILYSPTGEAALSDALVKARKLDLGRAKSEALSLARSFDWAEIGQRHAVAYRVSIGGVMWQQTRDSAHI